MLFNFRHKAVGRLASYDVTADGQTFILNIITANTDAPITLVQNFTVGSR